VRRVTRRDRTHTALVQALEAHGLLVLDEVASLPNFGCDAVVIHLPSGRARLCEFKDGALKPSARKLTDSEVRLAFRAAQVYRVVGSVDEALAVAQELLGCGGQAELARSGTRMPQDETLASPANLRPSRRPIASQRGVRAICGRRHDSPVNEQCVDTDGDAA